MTSGRLRLIFLGFVETEDVIDQNINMMTHQEEGDFRSKEKVKQSCRRVSQSALS
ncbi:MAG: hypothetical protein ACJZ70_14045 [Limisphaerales bacterium]